MTNSCTFSGLLTIVPEAQPAKPQRGWCVTQDKHPTKCTLFLFNLRGGRCWACEPMGKPMHHVLVVQQPSCLSSSAPSLPLCQHTHGSPPEEFSSSDSLRGGTMVVSWLLCSLGGIELYRVHFFMRAWTLWDLVLFFSALTNMQSPTVLVCFPNSGSPHHEGRRAAISPRFWINGENYPFFEQPRLKCAKSSQTTRFFE